jgi:hypothetical protein
MYIDELIELFITVSGRFPVLGTDTAKEELRRALEGRRYDLQDETLIEAILREDSRDLIDSFNEAYSLLLDGKESGDTGGGDTLKEAIRLYIASLEHMINYYHTSLIGKHFSST